MRYEGEPAEGSQPPIYMKDGPMIKILLSRADTAKARLLVISETPGGDLEPMVMNSEIRHLEFMRLRLPIGNFCKNRHYLVTVFYETKKALYWNQRKATYPMADCGGWNE